MPPAKTAPDSPITLSRTLEPASAAEAASIVREAAESGAPVFPLGGKTALDFGLVAKRAGVGLSTSSLNRVVDYPARDMTLTIEAGATLGSIAATLAAERQQLPFDVPAADQATIGAVIATNFNGPRRFGYGSIRDFVIGVEAIDGHGRIFHGGGRVVKNVAGYDFCKLLTGSMGTLGVVTQVTLKVRPIPEACETLVAAVSMEAAERLLDAMAKRDVPVASLDWLSGPAWKGVDGAPAGESLVVSRLEGTAREVAWMADEVSKTWATAGASNIAPLGATNELWRRLIEFPRGAGALVVKASVRPSGALSFAAAARRLDANVSIAAQAGSGVVFARFPELPDGGVGRAMIADLQPTAAKLGGSAIVLAGSIGSEATPAVVWGHLGAQADVMRSVKRRFDPKNVLNPGRFVFADSP